MNTPKAAIWIQAGDRETITAAADRIIDILNTSCGDNVKLEAMITLRTLCKVENVSITGNTFGMIK